MVKPTPGGPLTPWTLMAPSTTSASSISRCASPSPLHTLASPALPHTLLCASQIAVIALLGVQNELEYPLAQLELLYNLIDRRFGLFACAGASCRADSDRAVSRVSLPGCTPGTVFRDGGHYFLYS